ncbi:type 1 glutamine amidotransferase domain-containing protein [Kordiimonas pumila]|uniref:Type 1 glutamine amidotransferase domain-containing protein n=1 Tax=Kordiimonas pumila TaxID=2161677 RepID=A0ABV7D8Q8_9PROT|nr:type 1 glutamine amidotransferase domain-containing protein [Kordiimonas pumila]
MTKKILFVVSSHADLGNSGDKAGSWLEELASPYWQLEDAGYQVILASPKGGKAPLDPISIQDQWLSDAGRRFLDDDEASEKLSNTILLDEINPSDFIGIYLVGGAATTWDFPNNAAIKKIVEAYYSDSKIIGGVCHGVVGLVQAVDKSGEPIVKNKQVTSVSIAEDVMFGLDRIVPVLPEEMLRKLRAIYSSAEPLVEHVVVDPPFFTGQNPASAEPLGKAIVDHLNRHS